VAALPMPRELLSWQRVTAHLTLLQRVAVQVQQDGLP
jgi:hypothetical protein